MKKLLALLVALTMALTCVSAFAETVTAKLTIDSEVAAEVLAGFGVTEDDMAVVNPVINFINALSVDVIDVGDGVQIDLAANDADVLSLAIAMDTEGVLVNGGGFALASTLCPNYLLTLSTETIAQLMETVVANMPASDEGETVDPAALTEVFGGYCQTWFEAVVAAAQVGEPVTGEYKFEEYTFDTQVPVTVDVPAVAEATRTFMDQILSDPAAMAMLQGMAQAAAQKSGAEFNPDTFADELKAGFDEWMAHFPTTTEAQVYVNSDGSETFYMEAESTREGEDGLFAVYMFYEDVNHMRMGFQDGDTLSAGFAVEDTEMDVYFVIEDAYFGLRISVADENVFACDFYFMNTEKPLISFTLTVSKGEEATLSMDPEGKTVLAVETIMSGEAQEAVQGLAMDFLMNGLGTMMGTLAEQFPEIAELMGTAMAG